MRLRPLALTALFLAACTPVGLGPTPITIPGPSMSPAPSPTPPGIGLAGVVYDAAGKPVAEATVQASAIDAGDPIAAQATTSAAGAYTLAYVPRGRRVAVRASWDGGETMTEIVELSLPVERAGPLPLDLGPLPDLNGAWGFDSQGIPRADYCKDPFTFADPDRDGRDVTITHDAGQRKPLRGGLQARPEVALYQTWFVFTGEDLQVLLRWNPAKRVFEGQHGNASRMLPVGYGPCQIN